MELQIWPGDWGLPSVDAKCLAVMAYCKFSDVPITFVKARNPWKSPSGEFPVFKSEDNTESDPTAIFNFLRKSNWGLDHDMTSKQSADIVAFTALMEEKLVPALLHMWWVDDKTYLELTRPWYAKALGFPLSLYLPMKRHRDLVNRFQGDGYEHMTNTERQAKIYKDAKECLNLLSEKLGDKDFFFGARPASLDAVVFGYLSPLLKAPFPGAAPLQTHLKACANLCQLCQRVLNKHFPLSAEEEEALRQRSEETRRDQSQQMEFPHRRRNMVMAGMVALSAMVGYAFMSGLVQVEVTDADSPGPAGGDGGGEAEGGGPSGAASQGPTAPDFSQFDDLFDDEDEDKEAPPPPEDAEEERDSNGN